MAMSHPADAQLVAYFKGKASVESAETTKAHLADCRLCAQLISFLGLMNARYEGIEEGTLKSQTDWP
jgi:hypothetical protein